MHDTAAAATVTPIEIDPKEFATLDDFHRRVVEARANYNTARERAKDRKEELEDAQTSLDTHLARFLNRGKGSDLPLFNQSELLEKAQSDPVVTKLVERLLAAGQDTNALIVAGYTEGERNQASEWLDRLEKHNETLALLQAGAAELGVATVGSEPPEPPPFLAPQPQTAVEMASLMTRLSDAGREIAEPIIAGWTPSHVAQITAWLDAVERVKADKGEAVTFDDLPAAPEWLPAPKAVLDADTIAALSAGSGDVDFQDVEHDSED